MTYNPQYAPGQILVTFNDTSETFAKEFGERLGYSFLGFWKYGDAFIYEM